MKKIFFVVLGAFALTGARPDNVSTAKQLRYVVNLSGAAVHKQPSFKSATVRTLPVGAAIETQEMSEPNATQLIGAGFGLPGKWLKVTTPAFTGYLFSTDLTRIKPAVEKDHDGLRHISLLGAQKSTREERPKTGAKRTITEYANGTYSMTAYDGCFDHDFTFRKLALHEVYHHMINSHSGYSADGKRKLLQPMLIARKGNVYTFTSGDSDATQDLKLTVHKDGSIVISSYDCT